MLKPRIAIILLALFTAAISQAEGGVLRWYEQELNPYLAFQLGQFPRFKNRSVRVVAANQQSVSEEINDFEKYLRKRILQDLAAVPGVQLHSSQASDVQQSCQKRAELLLTIDAKLDEYDQQLSVNIGLIDNASPQGQQWVSGFSRSWLGQGSRTQRRATGRSDFDIAQQGSRRLPFATGQEDLLAAYITRQVDCQLGISVTELFIDASSLPAGNTLMPVIRTRLATNPLIHLTDTKTLSDTVLKLELVLLDGDSALYLLTAQFASVQGEDYIAAYSEAYLKLPQRLAQVPPVVSVPRPPMPSRPVVVEQAVPVSDHIIEDLAILVPVNSRLCNSPNPWRYGEKKLQANERLDNSACFAVQLSLDENLSSVARVFVASEDDFGDRFRILPSSCSALSDVSSYQRAGNTLRLPSGKRSVQTLRVDSRSGSERVFVIAITDTRLARDFGRFLQKLPGLCDPESQQKNTDFIDLKVALQRFKRSNPKAMAWRSILLNHS